MAGWLIGRETVRAGVNKLTCFRPVPFNSSGRSMKDDSPPLSRFVFRASIPLPFLSSFFSFGFFFLFFPFFFLFRPVSNPESSFRRWTGHFETANYEQRFVNHYSTFNYAGWMPGHRAILRRASRLSAAIDTILTRLPYTETSVFMCKYSPSAINRMKYKYCVSAV